MAVEEQLTDIVKLLLQFQNIDINLPCVLTFILK